MVRSDSGQRRAERRCLQPAPRAGGSWQRRGGQEALAAGAQLCPSSSRFVTSLLHCRTRKVRQGTCSYRPRHCNALESVCSLWLAPTNATDGSKGYECKVFPPVKVEMGGDSRGSQPRCVSSSPCGFWSHLTGLCCQHFTLRHPLMSVILGNSTWISCTSRWLKAA